MIESSARSTVSPWAWVVVASATALFILVGLVGSLIRSSSQHGSEDDDGYWFLGFYNNPHDSALFVRGRIFRRWTVNIGHPLGLLFTVAWLLILAALAILIPLASHP